MTTPVEAKMTQHGDPNFCRVRSEVYLGDLDKRVQQLLASGQAEPNHGQPTVEWCSRRGTDVVSS